MEGTRWVGRMFEKNSSAAATSSRCNKPSSRWREGDFGKIAAAAYIHTYIHTYIDDMREGE